MHSISSQCSKPVLKSWLPCRLTFLFLDRNNCLTLVNDLPLRLFLLLALLLCWFFFIILVFSLLTSFFFSRLFLWLIILFASVRLFLVIVFIIFVSFFVIVFVIILLSLSSTECLCFFSFSFSRLFRRLLLWTKVFFLLTFSLDYIFDILLGMTLIVRFLTVLIVVIVI